MKQIKFGKRLTQMPQAIAAAAGGEDRLRLAILIFTGVVTGFVAAAIECL